MPGLEIIIVGAGISGLASAIALSRAGHTVQIFERSSFKKDAGYMITLCAPANRVLESFGFDFKRARSTDCDTILKKDAQTLEEKANWTTRGYTGLPDDQIRSFYRPDLHDELKRVALLESASWKTPTLRLGCEIVSVDLEHATVYLKDGSSVSGDLIIGADGEKSLIRSAFPTDTVDPLVSSPLRHFRAIIPTEALLEDPETRDLYNSTKKAFTVFAAPDHRIIVWYEARDGLLQDLECTYVPKTEEMCRERDSSRAKAKALRKFADFHPGIVKVLGKAELVDEWSLQHGTGVWRLACGRALLVGDAGHSMLPFTGQGGAQGIEDTGALGVLFSNFSSRAPEDILHRLKMVEDLRRERTAIFQSLAGVPLGKEGQFAQDHPDHLIHKAKIGNMKDHLNFMSKNSYNVLDDSRKALDPL